MAKANLVLPNGAKVKIEGSAEEVASVLAKLSHPPGTEHKKKKKGGAAQAALRRKGPTGYIADLAEEGFFKTKRTLSEVQKKLEEKGHIYAQTSLSPPLIRLVRKKALRRIREKKSWVYVQS